MNKIDWLKLLKDRRVWAAGAAAVFIAILVTALAVTKIDFKPADTNSSGIAPDTEFHLNLSGSLTVEKLRKKIVFEPDIGYDLTQTAPNAFTVKPFKPLAANSTVKIRVLSKNFTYHVRNALLLSSFFPADNGRKVPVSTGIEFYFNSDDVTLKNFRDALKIEPAVEGEVTLGDGRFVFYPTEEFKFNTMYTVKLSPPLISKSGAELEKETSFSFVTISEEDQQTEHLFSLSGNGTMNALTSETPLVQAYIDEGIAAANTKVGVKLYRFDNVQNYVKQLRRNAEEPRYKYDTTTIDTKELTEYASFDITPIRAIDDDSRRYGAQWLLQLPETLPEGWYAAEFSLPYSHKQIVRQLFMQVSDLSVFHMITENNLLVWVNDATTGKPVPNAKLEVTGAYRAEATTGEDGTAHIADGVFVNTENEQEASDGTTFTVTANGKTFADLGYYYSYEEQKEREARKYMSYVFTDRPIYHTTDTIQVWGVVRPRSSSTPLPKTLTLKLSNGAAEQKITPQKNGVFSAEIKFENISSQIWTGLLLQIDNEIELDRKYLRIEDFVKPVYTAETAPEKPIYILDESKTAYVTLDVSTFDGTPASEFAANFNSWSEEIKASNEKGFKTDAQGHLRTSVEITENLNTWYPKSYGYSFSNNDAQDENFEQYGEVYAIHRDVMLQGKAVFKDKNIQVNINTNQIDISNIKTSDDLWEPDALKGKALNQEVTAKLHKIYYTKKRVGTHYDFINRVSVNSYTYVEHNDIVDIRSFTTEAGKYMLKDLPLSDNENCYYLELITQDSKNRPVVTEVYLGSPYFYDEYQDDGTHRYILNKKAAVTADDAIEKNGKFYFSSINHVRSRFKDNENVTFVLEDNDTPVKEMKGRILYAVVQDNYSNITLTEQPEITLPFTEQLLPNYVVTGAYFDGKHVFALEDKYMHFSPEQRELDIKLETDKKSYRPADNMNVTATVKNKQSGKPVSDASVVISVVDEAIFALEEQSINILDSLYTSIYYPNIQKYTSYMQGSYNGPGEKGGGGGDAMRTDFKDTAYFSTAKTNSDGKAIFSCKLPDNITSWRLTSLALTDNLHAGSTKTNVSATKDYFVLPIVSKQILQGDDFTVGLRSAGVSVADTDETNYTVTISSKNSNKTKQIGSTVRKYAGVSFDKLGIGDYTVTIKGECGRYSDTVQFPFSVIKSGVEVSLVKTFELKNGIHLEPLRYPVSMAVYDKAYRNYNAVLSSILRASHGGRADMRLARKYAAIKFQQEGASWYDTAALEDSISDISTGVISLLPYSKPDIELTSQAYLALPQFMNAKGLKELNFDDVGEFEGTKSAFHLLQALSGNTIAADLPKRLGSDTSLDYVDKMYLATALAVSGDEKTAGEWYDKLVKPNLTELEGISGEKAYYIPQQEKRSKEDCTAAASMLATVLSTDHADYLARFLADKKSYYKPYLFEQLLYLTRFKANDSNKAKFSYVLDGKTITETLDRGTKYITLTKDQLNNADFKVLSGHVFADVYYAGTPEQTADSSRKKIGLTKRIEAVDGGEIKFGSVVRITLTPNLSALDANIGETQLVIDDYIPSGMRFERYESKDYQNMRGWYLNSRQGQRLQFTAYGAGSSSGLYPIIYYARCAASGNYVVESAYINSEYADTWGASDRSTVAINE